MRDTSTLLYIHLNWSTWDRLPLLVGEVRETVYTCIQDECGGLRAEVLAIGGVVDHVHILVQLPPTIAVATLVKQLKGSSSHLVGTKYRTTHFFKWQGAYAASSVSPIEIPRVRKYIENQEQHHRDNTLESDLEFDS